MKLTYVNGLISAEQALEGELTGIDSDALHARLLAMYSATLIRTSDVPPDTDHLAIRQYNEGVRDYAKHAKCLNAVAREKKYDSFRSC